MESSARKSTSAIGMRFFTCQYINVVHTQRHSATLCHRVTPASTTHLCVTIVAHAILANQVVENAWQPEHAHVVVDEVRTNDEVPLCS